LGISQVSDTLLKTFDNLLLQRNPHYRWSNYAIK
jgi:hypothetical protein